MIRDQIIKGNLDDFKSEFNFEKLTEDVAFEHYANYLVLSRINSQIFDDNDYIEKVNVDKGQNFGIDGVALLINNTLVFSKDNIDAFKKLSEFYPSLNINFVFTQAKTTPSFDTGEVLKFITAVKEFLNDKSPRKDESDLNKFKELKEYMLSYETLKCVNKSSSPICSLFFVSTGNPATDDLLLSIIKVQKREIEEAFPIFKNVSITLVNRENLIKYYQETQNQVETRVVFKDKVDLGGIKGVGKAFLGHLPAFEFLKLITDDEGNFRQNLFYENVRDFKGTDNKVNQEIADTIKNNDFKDKFVLMNNGVTIVAKLVDTNFQGGEIKIFNYQIVNGCQTSNVLFLNRNFIDRNSSILIPLKLIECQDNDITNEITKATNNQNPVPEEAFIALEQFPKALQAFFDNVSKSAPTRLYYERRSREYDFVLPRINQTQIFHLHKLIRAVVAMFIEQPHSCHRYPGELYKQTKSTLFGKDKRMFTKDQSPYPYYTSCYTLFVIENLSNQNELNYKYKPFKFHLQMILRLLIGSSEMKNFETIKDTEKYCNDVLQIVYKPEQIKAMLQKACNVIDNSLIHHQGQSTDSLVRSSEFTNTVKETIRRKNFR